MVEFGEAARRGRTIAGCTQLSTLEPTFGGEFLGPTFA